MVSKRVTKCYAVEIREMVKAFIEKTPYLDLEECVYGNWEIITAEFLQLCPQAEVPPIDYEEMPHSHFYNRTISFQLKPGFRSRGVPKNSRRYSKILYLGFLGRKSGC
jgi:hypothetical protein